MCARACDAGVHVVRRNHGHAVCRQQLNLDLVAVGCEACHRAAVGQRVVIGDEVGPAHAAVFADAAHAHARCGVAVWLDRCDWVCGVHVAIAVCVDDQTMCILTACGGVDACARDINNRGSNGVVTINGCVVPRPSGVGAAGDGRGHKSAGNNCGAIGPNEFDFDFVAVGCEAGHRAAVSQAAVSSDEVGRADTGVF